MIKKTIVPFVKDIFIEHLVYAKHHTRSALVELEEREYTISKQIKFRVVISVKDNIARLVLDYV